MSRFKIVVIVNLLQTILVIESDTFQCLYAHFSNLVETVPYGISCEMVIKSPMTKTNCSTVSVKL